MGVVLWMMGALFSFCLMAVGARELSGEIDTFQTLFFRSLIGLIFITLIIYSTGRVALFSTRRGALHIGRNLFHFGGQYGWFTGIGLLPLAEVFALEFTVPIWTLLFAALFLKEGLTAKKILAILFGIAGVLVIVRPGSEIFDLASLIVIAAAICYSVAHVSTKALSNTDHPLTVLFYMCLVQLPVGLLLSLSSWRLPDPLQWLWLLLVGVTALTAHYCITRAMQLSEAGIVVTLDFLRLPLIAVVGVLFYHEPFDVALMLGAGLMLLGNLLNVYQQKADAPRILRGGQD
ncbi:DMT family transporter [Sedimenticola sp.]|uniref:DMT family transporter n=1 Tax=Sedimenticola sp. TaxID=1940285 RepID=UPI002588B4B4|nr:DMT family transporter [Sedimenticola sp.]MCW8904293.1 DMT family transporter [Sedimenticola sp.]